MHALVVNPLKKILVLGKGPSYVPSNPEFEEKDKYASRLIRLYDKKILI
jgi:hypothetical protein